MFDQQQTIDNEIDLIVASGALGRSPVYARLLRYLAAATVENRTASEIDIATDVFRKGGDFDSNQDSSVRVYVHNLRQRLDRFYEENGDSKQRVSIPKGEYRLNIGALDTTASSPGKPSIRRFALYGIAVLLLGNLLLMLNMATNSPSEKAMIAQSPIWQPILTAERPLLVVVGDYFIFGELDDYGRVSRMVREFNVNSSADLAMHKELEGADRYIDLNLSYLPQSMAFALQDLLSVVHAEDKLVNVIPASKLRTSDLKANDVLYVGYLSGLGILESYVFAASNLEIGNTYDELMHPERGDYYLSTAGIPGNKTYQDYAFLASFPGPGSDNHILVATGTRDAGLMFVAEALASTQTTNELAERMRSLDPSKANGYEALYSVIGSDRTSLDATLIHDARLDTKQIWTQH